MGVANEGDREDRKSSKDVREIKLPCESLINKISLKWILLICTRTARADM